MFGISFSFICDNYNIIINSKDNLNRTSLHYAYMMNDDVTINILEQGCAKKVKEKKRFLLEKFIFLLF